MGSDPTYNVYEPVNRGTVDGTGITSTTVAVTVLTANHDGHCLAISNTCDGDVTLTYNGAAWIDLPAQQGGGLDLRRITIPKGAVIGALRRTAASTTGWLTLTLI